MIVCICRRIDDEYFENEEELKQRIMKNDFKCGQCQLYYELMRNKDE